MNQKKVKSLQKKLMFRVMLIALVLLLVAVILSQVSLNAFWRATEESVAKSTSIEVEIINKFFAEVETLLSATSNSTLRAKNVNKKQVILKV